MTPSDILFLTVQCVIGACSMASMAGMFLFVGYGVPEHDRPDPGVFVTLRAIVLCFASVTVALFVFGHTAEWASRRLTGG